MWESNWISCECKEVIIKLDSFDSILVLDFFSFPLFLTLLVSMSCYWNKNKIWERKKKPNIRLQSTLIHFNTVLYTNESKWKERTYHFSLIFRAVSFLLNCCLFKHRPTEMNSLIFNLHYVKWNIYFIIPFIVRNIVQWDKILKLKTNVNQA